MGPWLFLVMINDLTTTNSTLSAKWKFCRRRHGFENCPQVWYNKDPRHIASCWSMDIRRQIQTEFTKMQRTPANGTTFKIVKSAKILGVTLRGDLKWNDHVDNITAKASQRIHFFNPIFLRMYSFCLGICLSSFPF